MQNFDMDKLVDEIARAVKVRLAGGGGEAQAADPAGCVECGAKVQQLIAAGAHRVGFTPIGDGGPGSGGFPEDVARTIDHTLLKPEATPDDIRKLCEEALRYGFASVCVNPGYVELAHSILGGTPVKVVAVVGFPLGATMAEAKAYEACEAVSKGADEIDMVINIGALKAGQYEIVHDDIRMVVEAVRPAPVKVILETSKLTDEEKVAGCAISKAAGAAFVKTSTGFGGGGATVDDVALMRKVVGAAMGVKASGGVRTKEQALAMIAAGANRIGASASVAIVTGKGGSGKGY